MDKRLFPRYPQQRIEKKHLATFKDGEPWELLKILDDNREYSRRLRADVDKAQKGGFTGTCEDNNGLVMTFVNGHLITAV